MNALRTTLIRVIQKTEETTFDLVLNKIAEEITKTALKTIREDPSTSPSKIDGNISTVKSIPKTNYISPERRQQIIHKTQLL